MPILFWICPDEREECFACDNEEQVYGEYLSEEMAVLDAIDLANNACATGGTSEIWHRSKHVALTLIPATHAHSLVPPKHRDDQETDSALRPQSPWQLQIQQVLRPRWRSIMTRLSVCELHRQNHPELVCPS